MKNRFIPLLACTLVMMACQKENDPVVFDYNRSHEMVVPEIPAPVVMDNFHKEEIKVEGDQVFADNNTSVQNIAEVWLWEIELTIIEPSQRDFSFLESADVFIKADGLPTQRMAYRTDIKGGGTVTLLADHINLAPYL